MTTPEREILRTLAKQYAEVAAQDTQDERRALWRAHNSFHGDRVPIYARAFAWNEMPESQCQCADPLCERVERELRRRLYWASLGDDSIFEPWISVDAAHILPEHGVWGLPTSWIGDHDPNVARKIDPPIVDYADADRMTVPAHAIDETETERRKSQLQDAIGDILPVHVERATEYRCWNADISTLITRLRGLDQLMLDMMMAPDWLHGVLAFMRDGILKAQEEAELACDWTLSAHDNQAMSYAEELADPSIDEESVGRDALWCFCASQETTLVGPDMFYDFMLQYQIPIMEKFGLVAYGCCEDLTLKIDQLRRIPNLRRIAVSPMADAARCAEQIGTDHIISYRPSPSDMVGYGFDEDRIRRILRRDLEACRGCHVDITLKDVETVQHDPARVRRWVEVAREVLDELALV
ncbi:MAG: hypothetical protein GY851_11400 [bacterium]|nr:hypothetical protein [bacterium]